MKFLDEVQVEVAAGKGGNGCASFRRERHIANGSPDGGNGGHGGSIYLEADDNLNTLIEFRYQSQHKAPSGEDGSKRNKTGASGADLYLKVPVGTEVYSVETEAYIGELVQKGQQLLVAKGGRGGAGNHCFKSGTNRSPKERVLGEPGANHVLRFSLKLLADVGLLGLPNAGKSTFIHAVSNAKPKIADYPFTTLKPQLGVVRLEEAKHFVVADIPGLIKGASLGAGLGLRFLKHLERTKLLLHIVDVAPFDGSDPVENMKLIHNELSQYSQALANKPWWIVLNKLDNIPESEQEAHCQELVSRLEKQWDLHQKPCFRISSLQKRGTLNLCQQIMQFLEHHFMD